MHTFLVRALPLRPSPGLPAREHGVLVFVATGTAEAAEGAMLGTLHCSGWRVLEVFEPPLVRERLPGLKRHPDVARAQAEARRRGMALLVLDLSAPEGP